MKSKHQRLREAIRSFIKKAIKENAEADAEWMVDKIATALDAAVNKDKDYQYVAAFKSDELKQLAQDLKKQKQEDEIVKEGFLDWIGGIARNSVYGIIDKREGYLQQALKHDPKLQRLSKEVGLSGRDFENKIYGLMQKDTSFLRDLAAGKLRSKSAYRF